MTLREYCSILAYAVFLSGAGFAAGVLWTVAPKLVATRRELKRLREWLAYQQRCDVWDRMADW